MMKIATGIQNNPRSIGCGRPGRPTLLMPNMGVPNCHEMPLGVSTNAGITFITTAATAASNNCSSAFVRPRMPSPRRTPRTPM